MLPASGSRALFKRLLASVVLLAAAAAPGVALPTAASAASSWSVTTSGVWSAAQPQTNTTVKYCGAPTQPTCLSLGYNYPGAMVRWGQPAQSGGPKSGLGYTGDSNVPVSQGRQVALGQFDAFNFPVNSGTSVTGVQLGVPVTLTDGTTTLTGTIPVSVTYDETPNQTPCPYPSPSNDPCSDKVSYTFSPFQATSGGQLYTVSVTGFSTSKTDSSQVTPYAIVNENQQTSLYLFASFTIGHPPVAHAGPDQTVEQAGANTTVTLDGSGSTDPDNDPLTYSWSWNTPVSSGSATGVQPDVQLPAGPTPITLTVSDGQFTSSDTVVIIVSDTTPPTISGQALPVANSSGWNNTPVTVYWTCADGGSGIATNGCPASHTLGADGAGQSVSGTAKDYANLSTTATVGNINIDQVPPTLISTLMDAPNSLGWFHGDVTVDWACFDAGGSDLAAACPAASTITGEGSAVTVTAQIADLAGNSTTVSSEPVQIDRHAPTSTITNVPEGWSASSVEVSLTAADNLSGVAAIHYRLDGGDDSTVDDGGSVTVSGDGAHTISYWAVDKAGNVETTHEATVLVDGTPPTITHVVDPVPVGDWNTGPATVTFHCADTGGSGLASCVGDTSFTDEGRHSGTGTATDNAGNTASDTAVVNIDATGPTVTASKPDGANAAGWYSGPVTVTFVCSDPTLADGSAGSGVSFCPGTVTLNDDGANQSASGTATDLAGNQTNRSVSGINIDRTPPTVTGSITTPISPDGWYAGDVTVHWTCADSGSGLAAACPPDSVVTGSGIGLTATVVVSDVAGNSTTAVVGGINIDRVAPTITGAPTTAPNNGWYTRPVTIHWDCGDALSGVASVGGCTGDTTLNTDGSNLYASGQATDKAGNTAGARVSGINIDQIPPTLTGTPRTAPNSDGWYSSPVTIDWAAHDAGSGVDPLVVPASSTISSEGTGLAASAAISDRAGNSSGPVLSAPVNIDMTPPSTTAEAPTGWQSGGVTVTLHPTDGLSSVATTHYSLDGGPTQSGTTVVIDSDGHHTLSFGSTDKAGNAEQPNTIEVDVDSSAPLISDQHDPAPNGAGWNDTPVKVTFSCSDPELADGSSGSGIATCGPDTTVSGEGQDQEVTGSAADNAGNSAADTTKVSVDLTKPSISAATTTQPNANGWYNGSVGVHFTCADALSGVAGCPEDAHLTDDGANRSASGTAFDAAGNSAGTSLSGINIDQTAPSLTGAIADPPNANGWYKTPVTVHFDAVDATSGIDPTTLPSDSTLTEGANQSVTATVSDLAGNSTSVAVSGVNVDLTRPSITATLSVAAPNAAGWYSTPVTVTFNCTDTLSGIAQCPAPVTFGDGANQSVNGTAVDRAGNTASIAVSGIYVDSVSPVITFTGNAGSYQVDQTVTIGCSATDALSGIASSTCSTLTAVPAYTLGVGQQSLQASATDNAGNTTRQSATFTVGVSCASLEQLTSSFSTSADIANALNAKLEAACSATTAGGRAGPLNAYGNQVRAQTGKVLTAEQSAILTRLAAALQ